MHSGLQRAARTAELLVAGLGLPSLETDEGLMEFDAGDWSGRTRDEIEQRWPGQLARWRAGELGRVPGGEVRAAFVQRSMEACRRIAARHRGRRVLCVTHGGVVRALQLHASAPRTRVPNLSGVWVSVNGDAASPTVALGEVVQLLPPVEETDSPTA